LLLFFATEAKVMMLMQNTNCVVKTDKMQTADCHHTSTEFGFMSCVK